MSEKLRILETMFIPVPESTHCVLPSCQKIIPKGQEAIQSPSTPTSYYHLDCFKILIRSTGKDPEKYLKIIPGSRPSQN